MILLIMAALWACIGALALLLLGRPDDALVVIMIGLVGAITANTLDRVHRPAWLRNRWDAAIERERDKRAQR